MKRYIPINDQMIIPLFAEDETCYFRVNEVKEELKKRDDRIINLKIALDNEKQWTKQLKNNVEETRSLINDIYLAFEKVYPYAMKEMKERIEEKILKENKKKENKDGC